MPDTIRSLSTDVRKPWTATGAFQRHHVCNVNAQFNSQEVVYQDQNLHINEVID